jgi:hypothetical protein
MDGSRILLAAAFLLLVPQRANSQVSLENVSLALGRLEGVSQGQYEESRSLPVAELELKVGLVRLKKAGVSLSSSVNAGLWWQNAPGDVGCADCTIYSYRAPTFGGRGFLELDHFPLPISFLLGYSRQHVSARYAYGAGILGNKGQDHSFDLNLIEFGTRISARVLDRLRVGVELVKLHHLESRGYRWQGIWRLSLRTAYDLM